MAKNKDMWRQKMHDNKAIFDQKFQELEEALTDMQHVEVEMIRDGGGVKKLDPLQKQY